MKKDNMTIFSTILSGTDNVKYKDDNFQTLNFNIPYNQPFSKSNKNKNHI